MDTFTHFGTVEDPAQNNKTVTYYQIWTQEKVFTVTDDMKVTRQEQHFCGDRIPVCLWKEPTYDLSKHYGSVTASDFVLNNEAVNIKLSDILRIADYQSFSILFTINFDAPGYIGPGAHLDAKNIKEGEPCHAEFLSPEAPLDKLQNILTMQMEQMHKAGRIPAGVVFPDNSATSGIHLVIQWFPIQKLFEELKPVYEENENLLAKTISLVQARWANRDPTRPIPEVDLYPNFDDESVMPRDDEAKRTSDEWELQQGIITPIDIMMQKDPDLEREEAKRKFKDNVKENQEIGYVPGGPTGNFQNKESLEGVLGQFDKDDEGFTGEA